jgi:hypothetical protein
MWQVPPGCSSQLATLLQRQDGVARRDQLAAAGVTWAAIHAQVSGRRWKRHGPNVIVAHNGPLNPLQEQWVAVLHCHPKAALAGRSAAAAGGLSGWASPGVEVLVRRGVSVAALPGIPLIVHESRRFTAQDVHPTVLPPRTRMERSLVDAAVWAATDRAACGILCAGVQQRLTTASRLQTELASAGLVNRRRLLSLTLHDVEGGARALSEIDFCRLCRRWRLPVTAQQVVRVDRNRKRRYLDVLLMGPDGRTVRAEVDGALHLLVRTYWDDMCRQNEYTIAGQPILRFSTVAVRTEELLVADQVARALALPSPLTQEVVRAVPGSGLLSP